jgi:hypothetical protein
VRRVSILLALDRRSGTSSMTSNASIQTTRSSMSRKCMSVSYLNLSPHCVADSSGRNSTSMTFPDLPDDTECCSAPSVGMGRMLEPRDSAFRWIASPRSMKFKFSTSGRPSYARRALLWRSNRGAANSGVGRVENTSRRWVPFLRTEAPGTSGDRDRGGRSTGRPHGASDRLRIDGSFHLSGVPI